MEFESLEPRLLLDGYAALQRPTELQYWDPATADNGYNFFGAIGTSYLLDMEGKVVHTWPVGTNPHLLSNGDVLDAATNDPSGYSGFKEVDWNGNTVWSYLETRSTYHPHHDFERIFDPDLNEYTTLYIANKDLTYDQLVAAGANPTTTPSTGAQMDAIVEVDMSGTIVWEWCFFNHMVQDYDASKANYVGAGKTIADYPNKLNINLAGHNLKADWLHCNSLDYNQSLDQIVVNSVQGEFYVIDHGNTFIAGNPAASIALAATGAGDFLYRFGDPARYDQGSKPAILEDWTLSTTGDKQLGGAHDIQWIADGLTGAGHFLIFNNAQYLSEHTSQSYVVEIDPYLDASGNNTGYYVNPPDAGYNTVTSPEVTDKTPRLISKQVVWNYASESNLTLFSQIGCSAQRLPNGNTLICADTEGYIMEVTPSGDTAWDYIVPVTNSGVVQVIGDNLPMVNSIFRAYRYEATFSAFAGHTLTPGATIAGRTTVANPYAGTANYEALQRQTETQYWDSTNAYNGYTFFAAQGTAYLIDMQGRVTHTWATGTDPRLLDSGNVLDWATNTSGNTGLKELDWNGNTVWQYYDTRTGYHPHGDFKRVYDPKLGAHATLYLANKDVTAAECIAAGCDPADAPYEGAQVDTIVEVDMSGNVVWEWSFWDHAIQNVDATKANYVGTGKTIADYPGKINLNLPGRPLRSNWLDCNSLDYNQSLDQIVVNSRQGELYVIDRGNTFLAGNPSGSIALAATTAGDFLYRFGDPARYSQGNPPSVGTNWETATSGNKQIGGSANVQWIAAGLPGAGHLLVFDNNQYLYQRTPQSYVFEINPYLNSGGTDTGAYVNPPSAGYTTWTFDKDTHKANQLLSKQVVWTYGSVSNLALFSHFGSSAQRLPNGNTLICATTEGYMVEVDASGNVVWEYINPVANSGIVTAIGDDLPMTNAVPRAVRYAASFAGFQGHSLTPGATLTELNVPEVKVIPAGSFVMGDHFGFVDPGHQTDELPLHTVSINAFSMGTYDITNQHYCTYLNSALAQGLIEVRNGLVYAPGGSTVYCETRQGESALFGLVYSGIDWNGTSFSVLSGRDNHPMVGVRWEGAAAYCNWLSAVQGHQPCYNLTTWACDFTKNGYRLPTEAEWEYAANGGHEDPYYQFPWGSNTNTDGTWANWENSGDPYETGDYPWTTPVGFYDGKMHLKSDFNWPGSQTSYQTSSAVNGYGLYDMGGNVWQWVNDWYSANYYSVSPSSNPTGPTSGDLMPDGLPYHGMRGGNWYNGAQYYGMSRISNRDPGYYRGPQDPNHPYYHVGFRVALNTVANTAPTVTGTTRTPAVPSATDAVWVTSTVTDDGSVAGVKLTYLTGSGTGTTTTPFTETFDATAVKPWTGTTGSSNPWTVTGTYFELRTGSNYVTSTTDCGMEYKCGTTLNALAGAMVATTNTINAAGTSGYVEFWLQSLTLDGTDGWTFQLDSGSGYVARLSELTGSNHGFQKYHYDLASSELVSTLKMRFQFTGGGTGDDDRIDVDQITVTVTAGSVPVDVTMYDDGAHGDGTAGDHVYGGQIPAMATGTTVSYYVTATDNAGLTASDPATAPTDKYSYIVGHATPQLQLNEFLADSTTFTATSDYPTQTLGLSINTADAMSGYTLLDPMHGKTTYLIDNAGQIVHSWTSAYEPGRTAYLMPNGHLFRACMAPGGLSTGGGEGGRIEERDWDGNLVWCLDYATSDYMMHHDFKVLPNGNILMLVAEKKLYANVIAAGFNPSLLDSAISTDGYMIPDSVVEIQPAASSGGTVVWQWHVWDHLIQDYSSSKANYGVVAQHPELIDANGTGTMIPEFWNHLNGIDYNAALDQIMLSARNQDEVWIIDHSTTTAQAASHSGGAHGKGGDLLYRWGNPQMYDAGTASNEMLYQQHNTQWIASDCPGAGNILVFNNGLGRPAGAYSSIDEFTPPVDASGNYALTSGSAYGPSSLTWTYVASPPASFYSAEISGAERLPNGDTLICEGLTGRVFEVTAAGQIVWQYQNPVCDTGILEQGSSLPADPRGGYMTAVFRALKYPTTYAAFAGRTLTPSGKVEVYPDWIEIRSPAASAVDMGGMYLTNDANTPKKFQIPTGVSIPAGGYLLFWADNNTALGSRHTNFTLSSTGGTILLYDTDGITRIDTVTYGAQTTNISYGRSPDGTGAWQAMTTVTPGAANASGINHAPTDIALSSTTVSENLPAGTAVGTLSTTDPDTGNTFTYALVSGTGSTDNALFSISGSTLLTAASFDYETKNSYSVRVRSTDQGSLYVEKAFTIAVTDANDPPTITGTTRTPAAPTASDAVRITSTVTDDGSVSGVTLTYSTGSGTPTTTTVFTETMCSAAVKPWTGTGAVNAWTVTGNYLEQRTGSNYGTGNACGMEYKGGGTLNTLTSAMVATANAINAAGTSGYVEFWLQSLTLEGTDGWTFQLDPGTGYVTRLSELTGSNHAWQKYHYDLASSELVGTLKMRFQFTGGGAGDDDRIDLDQITVTVTSGGTSTSTVTMYDDGAHGDGAAGDHVYGGQIPAMALGTTVSYYVTATDNAGLTASDPATAPTNKYSYTVQTNQAPTDIALSTATVAENLPAGTAVGTLNTTDPNTGNTFTYSLVSGTGNDDNASFTINGNILQTVARFNYEAKNSYSIRVRSTDQGGLYTEKVFTITVTDVNEQPTEIVLSHSSISENQPAGTVVGVLSGTDPDAGQSGTLTFSLAPRYGDNDAFAVDPTTRELRTVAVLNCDVKSSNSIRVTATDTGGLTCDKTFTINVTPGPLVWTGAASDDWQTAGNWLAGIVPGASTAVAFLASSPHQPALNQNGAAKGVDFAGAGWTLGGTAQTLTVGAGGIDSAGGGTNTVSANVALAGDSTWTVGDGSMLVLNGALGGGNNRLIKDGAGTLALNGGQDRTTGLSLNVDSGTLSMGEGYGPLVLTDLSINSANATLDLSDNSLIVHYTDGVPGEYSPAFLNVRQRILSAYAEGTWSGPGITSTSAAGQSATYGLGYAQNDLLFNRFSNFAGQDVDPTTVLVKYTYIGDVNLDGKVDDNDVTVMVLNYDRGLVSTHTWEEGDVSRYDGKIDDNDITLLVLNYGAGWKPGRGGPLCGAPVATSLPKAAPEVLMPPNATSSAPPVEDADLVVYAQAAPARQTALGSAQAAGNDDAAPTMALARSGSYQGSAFSPVSGTSAADDPPLVLLVAASTPLAWSTAEKVAPAPGALLSPDGGVEDLLLLSALEVPTR